MKITELRIGDTVRKKGDTALFRVRNLYEEYH